MMADEITCTLCDGTEFYKEAGFYYCKECQTQSQEIREHVFDVTQEAPVTQRTSSKRIQKEKKTEDRLTSWECYNYILFGLVNELIELGANPKLKSVVHKLWFKYLEKLEVINHNENDWPKLSAVNSKLDAEIIYGRSAKRKRKSRSRTPSPLANGTLGMTSSVMRKEKAKQRRSLALAEYDEFSQSLANEDVSLHNQSLLSLKSGSDTSSQKEKYLKFNKPAKKEILNVMSKNHLKTHCRDVGSSLNCHNLSYRSLSKKYVAGASVLTRSKIYALIYIGLLIIKDKIQLADLIRFIREGHLSFHEIQHFFPETYTKRNLNIATWNEGNHMLSHSRIRLVAAKIAKYLEVSKYIPRQNLANLCQRYCLELNLPNEIWGYTLNLVSRAMPTLQMTSHSNVIPNYEGRIISMIAFVLKLLFGLDDVTEKHFSEYALYLNVETHSVPPMFVWSDWARFIGYRRLVIAQQHYPTQCLYDNDNTQNSNLFVNFIVRQHLKYEKSVQLNRQGEVLQQLLEKQVRDKQILLPEAPEFSPTLTPFSAYIEELLAFDIPKQNNYLEKTLLLNFKDHTITFLTNPLENLEELNKSVKVGIKHRGANKNLVLINYQNMKTKRESWRLHAKKTVPVNLTDTGGSNANSSSKVNSFNLQESTVKLNSQTILNTFESKHVTSYKKNLLKSLKLHSSQNSDASLNTNSQSQLSQSSSINENKPHKFIHYNPYERYWLRNINLSDITKEQFSKFLAGFPESFQLLLNECARITEQNLKDMMEEFTTVEIYLCYVAKFTASDKNRDEIRENSLIRLINKANKDW